ncbi:NADH-quinone oxidoreductase subunit NuoG [Nitrospira moscoviensis]|uniref:NADH-quinone oxidoreductase n=1 Tax=Nitrospira moscoviensis TaxID=42253 RepID=A0A0K2GE01_NITMO|nr:NADH-quinone oxidoreductase subunit NuoG [Nitrospira moscoviensis]ALA59190.1 NADH-ubiquinone oxidoreductase, subunit G [Nitrospira moscoviensis]
MATIFIDNKPHTVDGGQNLLAACLSAGLNLPYFCWHPAMGSVGACRQCAVTQYKDEQDREGKLVMACMTPAADGTRLSIDDRAAAEFRAGVIEWLMMNHPHDCPVCDEGGECHLQDMTVMTGHNYRRYRFPKRTYRNQYLGPFIKHDMNRCIQCYRCVRFYRDYAGGRDFNVFASHDNVYFGRYEEGPLENEFSGNLVEVCPTGVFIDNTLFQHYTRKWDLQSAQSICPHCSLGCNTTPGERYGILRRIANRFNRHVNGYFLCDRGRFGYGYVNDDGRIRRPAVRVKAGDPAKPEGTPTVVAYAAGLLRRARGLVGIGSPRASLEANVALRSLVGAERFSLGLTERDSRLLSTILDILRAGPVPAASLREVEESDAVLVLGEDVLNSAPRLALALLQSLRQQPMARVDRLKIPRWDDAAVSNVIQGRKGPLFLASHRRTWLHDYATGDYLAAPDDVARLGFAAAHAVDERAPSVPDLSGAAGSLAPRIADALMGAERPVIVAGAGGGSRATIESAANLAWALHRKGKPARLAFIVPECNSLGLAMLGGRSLDWAFDAMRKGEADTAIVLENDLYRRADEPQVGRFLSGARGLIAVDSLDHRTVAHAHVILPAATAPESDGTLVNNEGRAQRFYQVFVPEGDIAESWRWLRELARAVHARHDHNGPASWRDFDDAVAAVAETVPEFAGVKAAAPPAGLRFAGEKIPRQPERYSGRTAMLAHLTVHEPPPPADPDTALAFSMEGYRGGPVPSPLIPQFWAPGWNSNQALHKYQDEVGGPLREERPGVRLIEPDAAATPPWFTGVPKPFQPKSHQWLVLPLPQIFGGEELSARSPAIQERMPAPFLRLHPADAAKLGLQDGAAIILTLDGRAHPATVAIDAVTPSGTAGVPPLPGFSAAGLPRWIDLREAIRVERRAA